MTIQYLVYLRLLAILLIVNSHLEPLYPNPSMVVGGHLGNSLFFFISGIGLTLSYRRAPLPALQWARKRVIKAVLPVLIFIGVIYLGHLQHFIDHIFKYLIWHDRYQLQEFLPVLWGLYLLFLPLNRLPTKALAAVLGFAAVATLAIFAYRIQGIEVPKHLPSSDIFFTLNALLCFMLGLLVAARPWQPSSQHRLFKALLCAGAALITQVLHAFFAARGGWLIVANFYINFMAVLAIYGFFVSFPLQIFERIFPLFKAMAAASLAVYIVHPKIITILSVGGPEFPYNAMGVYLYSFLAAYAMTVFADHISSTVLQRLSTRG